MNDSIAVGVDLGGTTINGVTLDEKGRVRAQHSIPTPANRGPDAVIESITSLVTDLTDVENGKRSTLIGVGVGAPGPLDIETGMIIRAANLPGWVNVPLRDRLAEALRVPVCVENDGNAAAYGEFRAGAGDDRQDMVMLTLGTGVGAGVIIDGRILHGHFGNAAELGHMIVVPDGLPCSCGQRGCLEPYASARAVATRVASAIEAGEESRLSKGRLSGGAIDAERVVAAARDGDRLCLRIWEEACRALGTACINLQHAFDPARIVLGGGMAAAGSFLFEKVRHFVAQGRWTLYHDAPQIVPAQLGRDAGAMGAAAIAQRNHAQGKQ